MPLNLAHNPVKIAAFGISGFGKTLFINDFVLRSNYRYYFIFDHDGQFAQRNRLSAVYDEKGILRQLVTQRFVIYNPSEMFFDETRAVNWFARVVYRLSEGLRGTKLFYLDEIQDNCGTDRAPKWLRKILVSGRNRSIDFCGCSLQYNMVHNAIRGQINRTVAFFTDEDLAIDQLVKRGFKEDSIRSLGRGDYIDKNKLTGREERGNIFVRLGMPIPTD